MRKVYKYPSPISDECTTLEIPSGATYLDFQVQNGEAVCWFLVYPENKIEQRRFVVHGTGHPVADRAAYLGTIQAQSGRLVWHLFELK